MELSGYGVIKLIDRATIKDNKTDRNIVLWKFYIQGDDGSALAVWSQVDWSLILDVPAYFILKIGNKGKGFWLRIVDVLPKDERKAKK